MICQQCGQAVFLDMASDHLPPWCQRCGADIRDALYGAKGASVGLPAEVLNAAQKFDSNPLPVRERRPKARSATDAQSPPSPNTAALLVGVALLAAAVALTAFRFLS